MRVAALCFLLALSGLIRAAERVPPSWMVGLWQFDGHTVWIKIDPNGDALQCRIAPGGTVYKSEGRYGAGESIRWEINWGTDKITRQEGLMSLSGKYGSFAYHRTDGGMSPRCLGSSVSSSQ
jgi:hypothetical protein